MNRALFSVVACAVTWVGCGDGDRPLGTAETEGGPGWEAWVTDVEPTPRGWLELTDGGVPHVHPDWQALPGERIAPQFDLTPAEDAEGGPGSEPGEDQSEGDTEGASGAEPGEGPSEGGREGGPGSGCDPREDPSEGETHPNDGTCEPERSIPVHLTTGREDQIADMWMRTGSGDVEIIVTAWAGWDLGKMRVRIDTGASAFMYRTTNGYADEVRLVIETAELGLTCGNPFDLTVLIGARREGTSGRWLASATGEHRHTPPVEGWEAEHRICCETSNGGCTYTQGYWRNHQDAWPTDGLSLGSRWYSASALITLLWTPPRGDASLILAHQLIAALLNELNGAAPSAALGDAHAWLNAQGGVLPLGVAPSTTAGAAAIALAEALTAYNEGHHCAD